MPRTARTLIPGHCYHVINRGNNRARVFHEHADYAQFVALMREASERIPLPLFAATLMPNHIHLVVRPDGATDISQWIHWLFTTHVRRYHIKYQTSGSVWQGRFKAFVIEEDHHLLTVMRYVERNALRSGLVNRAEDWHWGSLRWRTHRNGLIPVDPPISLPANWIEYVNAPQTASELTALRASVNRQRPFGSPNWVEQKARELGITSSLGRVGRPAD